LIFGVFRKTYSQFIELFLNQLTEKYPVFLGLNKRCKSFDLFKNAEQSWSENKTWRTERKIRKRTSWTIRIL